MPKYVELSIDGVIHESEIFGAAMPERDTDTECAHDHHDEKNVK